MGRFIVEDGIGPVRIIPLIGGTVGGHGHLQHMTDGCFGNPGMHIFRHLIGEKLDHRIIKADFSLTGQNTDGSRCKTLAGGVHAVLTILIKGLPVVFKDHFAAALHQNTVHRETFLFQTVQESLNRRRRDANAFRRRDRQFKTTHAASSLLMRRYRKQSRYTYGRNSRHSWCTAA